ncbi:MAG: hypothetical protein K6E50_02425 [Lachnospiraceae bacterium]|nr:hypothetical protein [Lachnospiraceae bacterium]
MISLECPNCGGRVQRPNEKDRYAKCPYCGGEVYFEEIHSTEEFHRLQNTTYQLQQENNVEESNRKNLREWTLMRNIFIGYIAVTNFIAWVLAGFGAYSEKENVTGIGAIVMILSFAAVVSSPFILAHKRSHYDVLNNQIDQGAKIKAFVFQIIVNVVVVLITILMAYVFCLVTGMTD